MKKIISALLILTMILSVVCVSTSAANIHINMNFDNLNAFTEQFRAGAFYIEEGILFGYAEAKALQTDYNDEDGIFQPHNTCWLTYDASITLSVGEDELSEDYRHINVVYCNDNLRAMGRADNRIYMAFRYDIEKRCFTISEGLNGPENAVHYTEPVAMELPTESEEAFTMGISVQKDNIRCFYNDQLIFNYTNPEMLIAYDIVSPFVFWQEGNFTQISNVTIGEAGSIYPIGTTPAESSQVGGDNNGNNNNNNNNNNNVNNTPTQAPEATTSKKVVDVTDDKGNAVTDASGNKVTEEIIVTDPPVADTNPNNGVGGAGTATPTGDVTFIVVAAMVAAIGCALIVKKVNA